MVSQMCMLLGQPGKDCCPAAAHTLSARPAGEHFDGRDQQLTGVWRLAQETFGGSWSKGLVTALVKAYLRVPGRG